MAGDIHVYTLEARNREETPAEHAEFETEDYQEARDRAYGAGLLVIDNTYTWSDSEMVDDFTPEPDEPDADEPDES